MATKNLSSPLRHTLKVGDRQSVRRITTATRFFRPDEIAVAVELLDEQIAKGDASGYHFVFWEEQDEVVGYACYGPTACTLGSFDLYWIAIDPRFQKRGIGQALMAEVELRIARLGGRHIYIETSSRPQYLPTRLFYQRCGYEAVAQLADFYDRADDKIIWRKICSPSRLN